MSLAEKLNAAELCPVLARGRVTGLTHFDVNETVSDETLVELGLDPANLGFLEDHPEGADRGGYVPTVYPGGDETDFDGSAFYSDTCGEWQG